jgi:hypothetical protein
MWMMCVNVMEKGKHDVQKAELKLMILLQAECEDTGSVSSAKKREISK